MLPPTKFDLIKGAFFLACGIIGGIMLICLVATAGCMWFVVVKGELGRCAELKIGEYLNSALLAVMAILTVAAQQKRE